MHCWWGKYCNQRKPFNNFSNIEIDLNCFKTTKANYFINFTPMWSQSDWWVREMGEEEEEEEEKEKEEEDNARTRPSERVMSWVCSRSRDVLSVLKKKKAWVYVVVVCLVSHPAQTLFVHIYIFCRVSCGRSTDTPRSCWLCAHWPKPSLLVFFSHWGVSIPRLTWGSLISRMRVRHHLHEVANLLGGHNIGITYRGSRHSLSFLISNN